jgi:hypothetical protein
MSMTEEEIVVPRKRFTPLMNVAAIDEYFQMTTCLDCGATVIIREDDIKNGIHPMAIHVEFHDGINQMVASIEELVDLVSMNDEEKKVFDQNVKAFKEEALRGKPIQSTGTNAVE